MNVKKILSFLLSITLVAALGVVMTNCDTEDDGPSYYNNDDWGNNSGYDNGGYDNGGYDNGGYDNGGYDNGDDNGGNNGGNSEPTSSKPQAPSGLSASVSGSVMLPSVDLSWNAVDGAESYNIYRSSSASGTYTKIGMAYWTSTSDGNPLNGKNYYKVTAVNSKGESPKSDYAMATIDRDAVSPCPPTIKLSGKTSSIKVSWTPSTSSGCGKPTSYVVYLRQENGEYYQTSTEITSTSYTVNGTYFEIDGYVRIAVKAINAYGESYKEAIWDATNNTQMM